MPILQFLHSQACDAAGPGFMMYDSRIVLRNAAKNVQCIHTSLIGAFARDCDQDWIMGWYWSWKSVDFKNLKSKGKCGLSQPAANLVGVFTSNGIELSHTLCNDFYINAFEHEFLANNVEKCSDVATHLPPGFRMGYMETRKRSVERKFTSFSSNITKHPVPRSEELLHHRLRSFHLITDRKLI